VHANKPTQRATTFPHYWTRITEIKSYVSGSRADNAKDVKNGTGVHTNRSAGDNRPSTVNMAPFKC